jgi:hypothetical protein
LSTHFWNKNSKIDQKSALEEPDEKDGRDLPED